MNVMQNPYIQQLGLQPMEQQAKPLEGILNPRTLTTFGASLLAGGQGQSGLSTIGNAILNTQNYVDQYNQRINEGAMKNASFNLQLANVASDYDIKQQQLGLSQQELGLKQREYDLKQLQLQKENDLINSILNGGAPTIPASVIPTSTDTTTSPTGGFNAMTGMMNLNNNLGEVPTQSFNQSASQVTNPVLAQAAPTQAVDSILPMANKYMQIGAITGRPELVTYGKALLDQAQSSPQYKEQVAASQASGKVAGEDKAALEATISKMPELLKKVGELRNLANEATYTKVGGLIDKAAKEGLGITTKGALSATEYQSKIDNQILPLLKATFGAQFTVQEGENLKATLGKPDMSPEQKQVTLDAFISQKIDDVTSGSRRFGIQAPNFTLEQSKTPQLKIGTVQGGYTYKGGDPASPSSWSK